MVICFLSCSLILFHCTSSFTFTNWINKRTYINRLYCTYELYASLDMIHLSSVKHLATYIDINIYKHMWSCTFHILKSCNSPGH